MRTTPRTLSVVVPVHNAQRNLTQRIGRLLEVLPDLAAKFEVLIVDDGSTDQTEEVALELSYQYPQVSVTRHHEQLGIEASAQTGAARTTGDIVIVHAGQEPVNASQLQRMWLHRQDEELVVAPMVQEVADEQSDAPARGTRPTRFEKGGPIARPPRGPKKTSLPAPKFRFSSFDSHSSMHQ